MSSLAQAFDQSTLTWNGAPAVTLRGVAAQKEGTDRGGALVAASAALVRPASHRSRYATSKALKRRTRLCGRFPDVIENLHSKVEEILRLVLEEVNDKSEEEQAAQLEDLCVLAMQLRDCRGGKGERALCYHLLLSLYDAGYQAVVLALVSLLPTTFGSWKDVIEIYTYSMQRSGAAASRCELLRNDLLAMLCHRLERDGELLKLGGDDAKKVSLLGKWAPRERRAQDKESSIAKAIAKKLFSEDDAPKRAYRRLVSELNAHLRTVEVHMSAHKWDDIDPSTVPSCAMNRYRNALLNTTKSGAHRSNDHARQRLATRVSELAEATIKLATAPDANMDGAKTLKGKQLFPYEIVRRFLRGSCNAHEAQVLEAQWAVQERVFLDGMAEGKSFGNALCICDVSGSMSGIPMENCIALGLILAKRLPAPWKDRILTFSTDPAWFTVDSTLSLESRIRQLARAPWGGSTNFQKTLEMILNTAKTHNLSNEQMPAFLFCFTDMQFNVADYGKRGSGFLHTAEGMEAMYHAAGYEMPHVVFWNLNGAVTAYAASADSRYVSLLSGFSPALLKAFVGGPEELKAFREATPYETLRRLLDDERYNEVRALVRRVQGTQVNIQNVGDWEMVDTD